MPRLETATTRVGHDLVCFAAGGAERSDDPDGVMSDLVLRTLAADDSGVTDVFLLSHGWMGDIPAARRQYGAWVESFMGCGADIASMNQVRPGFKPHIVGLHWPSMPWGDESFGDDASFAIQEGDVTADPVEALVDEYASRIADTPLARDAIRQIVSSAIDDIEPDTLPLDVINAYRRLNIEMDLGIGGVGSRPGGDRSGFAPEQIYQALREDAPSFGLGGSGGVLGVLRTLSFWRMKDRARWFGETVGSQFLARMMQAAPRGLRFHLMGHSFGCIVMSATLTGPKGRGHIARPIDSLALMQGALSIWSYCDDIPATPGQPGYFNRIIGDGRVRGSIVATQSVFDTATGKWYPFGAGVAGQVAFAVPGELPKYGAVGTHGIRGPGINVTDMPLQSADAEYNFAPCGVYNLECSEVIREGGGRSGAHSDIYHPELAHAVWQAALSAR